MTAPAATTMTPVTPTKTTSITIAPVPAGDGNYTNTAGQKVPDPVSAPSAPAIATAQCADGTDSFSQSRSGTCSHLGGVATWLRTITTTTAPSLAKTRGAVALLAISCDRSPGYGTAAPGVANGGGF